MTLSEKINKVLEAKGLPIARAERIMGISVGTLTKVMERDAGWHTSTEEKFMRSFNISPIWWDTGQGDVFLHESKLDDSKEERALQTAYLLIDKLQAEIEILKEELTKYRDGFDEQH